MIIWDSTVTCFAQSCWVLCLPWPDFNASSIPLGLALPCVSGGAVALGWMCVWHTGTGDIFFPKAWPMLANDLVLGK